MARKKTVTISRKPSAGASLLSLGDPAISTSSPTLAINMEPYAESFRDAPEIDGAPSSGPIGRVIYGTVFCISYSVVFSALLLGKIIPGSALIGRGLHDGADAAQRSFEFKTE